MKHQEIIFTNDPGQAVDRIVCSLSPSSTFVLVDSTTASCVLPRLAEASPLVASCRVITIPAGDVNKNLDSLSHIWSCLQEYGANRRSLLINLGGGMVTDIGGFAAATFKRGIRFINVPTTLLSAVDAAVGGKTGINFGGLKNEVGVFREADAVVISTIFFHTLPSSEVRSGYAEMLKHGLLKGPEAFARLLDYDVSAADDDHLLKLLGESVEVKRCIVEQDPTEKGIRRALNLGHTVGHAFESFAMYRKHPVPHGYAVAWGIVVELILSHMALGFDSTKLHALAKYVSRFYGPTGITCDDYPALIELMRHDKKNETSDINFTFMRDAGDIAIDSTADESDIKAALDIFRDFMGE